MDDSTKLAIIKSKILQYQLAMEDIKYLHDTQIMDDEEYLAYTAITATKYLDLLMEELQ